MADNFKPQSVLAGNMSSTSFTLGQGNWARRWGRSQPVHGTASSPEAIIGEVEEGRFSQDLAGVAYGSGTVWVRCRFQDDTVAAGEGELASFWMGVPATLPSGYTIRDERNLRPAVSIANSSANLSVTESFQPVPSVGNFVRTADGLYTPKDNSNTYSWGPWNRDNLCLQDAFSAAVSGDATNLPRFYSPAAPADGTQAFNDLIGGTQRHPGFRSIRYIATWAPATYTAGLVTSMTTQLKFASGGLSTISVTTSRGDLSYDATTNRYIKDWGNVGELLMPTGDVGLLAHFTTCTYSGAWPAGVSYIVYQNPRVDIPLPFTCTYGNVVAPGGILTGSIPTY